MNKELFSCPLCQQTFSDSGEMIGHYELEHTSQDVLVPTHNTMDLKVESPDLELHGL